MVASYFKLAEYPPLASLLLDHIRKEGHSTVPSNFNLGNLNFIVLVRCSLRLGRTRLRPHNQAGVTQAHIRSLTHYLLWSTLLRERCYLPWLSLLKWFLRTSSGQAPKQNVHLKPKVKFATKWKLQLVEAASLSLVLFCWLVLQMCPDEPYFRLQVLDTLHVCAAGGGGGVGRPEHAVTRNAAMSW